MYKVVFLILRWLVLVCVAINPVLWYFSAVASLHNEVKPLIAFNWLGVLLLLILIYGRTLNDNASIIGVVFLSIAGGITGGLYLILVDLGVNEFLVFYPWLCVIPVVLLCIGILWRFERNRLKR